MAERLPHRRCSWCDARPIERRGALYCSHACRQAAYRHRRLIDTYGATVARDLNNALTALSILLAHVRKRHPIIPAIPEGSDE